MNKTAIGDYLGEKNNFNEAVLKSFVELHDFTDLILVQALRQFLWSFRLPGKYTFVNLSADILYTYPLYKERMAALVIPAWIARYCNLLPGNFWFECKRQLLVQGFIFIC